MLKHLRLAVIVPLARPRGRLLDDDDGGDDATGTSTTEAEAVRTRVTRGTGETVTIVASVPPTDHGWLGQIAAKAQEAADSHDDVEFRLLEAADADSQASQIETVINERPDVIVVLPYDGDQLTPIAEAAMEAGIPVVNVDRLFATPGGGSGHDPRRQLRHRRQRRHVPRRGARLRGQRRGDPGHRRDLGDRGPQLRASPRPSRSCAVTASRSSPSSRPTSRPTSGSRSWRPSCRPRTRDRRRVHPRRRHGRGRGRRHRERRP